MYRYCLILAIFIFLSLSHMAEAKRVALIIGNGKYEHTSILANPARDAQLLAQAADRAGFDDITIARDLSVEGFRTALRDFRKKANGADIAMIYYAGHGIEGQGQNWLIPTDAELNDNFDLPYEAIALDRVTESLSGAQVRMVVLDACRNNPFARSWKSGTRAVSRGLIGIEADDVLVIYAAAPGQTAADGDGDNSPFATALAKRLPQADLPIQLLGGSVRDDVLIATGGSQRPFVSASITGTPIYLVGDGPGNQAETQIAPPSNPVLALDEFALDALAWQGALSAGSLAAYANYLEQFPGGKFARLASENMASLRQGEKDGAATAYTGMVKGFLPDRYAVAQGESLPIDGIWTISSIKKRIRIEKGRAYALDGWTHAIVFNILPDMVVLQNFKRNGPGRYEAEDLPLVAKSEMKLRADGNLDVKIKSFPFATTYTLIRETLDDPEAMAAEQAIQGQ